jgi:AcrR family transcriptional regulator
LLHYYFGTKERLLVEVVRRECDVRKRRLQTAIEDAETADQVLDALVRSFQDFLGAGPTAALMHYEMLTQAQRNTEIAGEMAHLGRSTRAHLADILRAKHDAGALELRADPEAVALFLFALADGLTVRSLSEPGLDVSPAMDQAVAAARALLG